MKSNWYFIDSWIRTSLGWSKIVDKGPFFADHAQAGVQFSQIVTLSPINSYVRTFTWNKNQGEGWKLDPILVMPSRI